MLIPTNQPSFASNDYLLSFRVLLGAHARWGSFRLSRLCAAPFVLDVVLARSPSYAHRIRTGFDVAEAVYPTLCRDTSSPTNLRKKAFRTGTGGRFGVGNKKYLSTTPLRRLDAVSHGRHFLDDW